MGWFSRNKEIQIENKEVEAFRTVNTEGKDLSQPFVDDYYSRGYNWVFFGEDNLYPQTLNQLYISSPMHQACCNFKKYSLVGNGYEWEGYEKLDIAKRIEIKQFEIESEFKQSTKRTALDWVKHGRVIALVHYSNQYKKYTHFRLVDPESIRNNHVGLFTNRPTMYYYSRDWQRSAPSSKFTPLKKGNTDEWQVMEIRNDVGGFKSYGMPDWVSSANWQKVGADIALLHKSAIENGIQPSVIFRYPYTLSPTERDVWEDGMRRHAKGASNYGRAMKVEANGKENLPEVDIATTTDNHALFEQTSKEYKEETAISHNLDPALMGVRIAGSLGAQDEKEFAAEQFKKLWVNSNREIVEDFLNQLSTVCGIETKLHIKDTDILTMKEVVENGGTTKPATTENLESQTQMVNDALKGLSAKENQDLMRIVRDFTKGRLSEPIAKTRLLAYGIDQETINEILTA